MSVLLFVTMTASGAGQALITVNATHPGPDINPTLYGIFLEEINHGVGFMPSSFATVASRTRGHLLAALSGASF